MLSWAMLEVLSLREQLATGSPGANPAVVYELLESPLRDSTGETIVLAAQDWSLLVLVFFTPQDCPICHDELGDLEVMASLDPRLQVAGVMGYGTAAEAEQTRHNYGLGFPILPDPEGFWIERLGVPEFPWKVVLRADRESLLFEDPRSNTPVEREAFMTRLQLMAGGRL